jgi:hypothetical protein
MSRGEEHCARTDVEATSAVCQRPARAPTVRRPPPEPPEPEPPEPPQPPGPPPPEPDRRRRGDHERATVDRRLAQRKRREHGSALDRPSVGSVRRHDALDPASPGRPHLNGPSGRGSTRRIAQRGRRRRTRPRASRREATVRQSTRVSDRLRPASRIAWDDRRA